MTVRELLVEDLPEVDQKELGVDDLAPNVILIIAVDEDQLRVDPRNLHPQKGDLLAIRPPETDYRKLGKYAELLGKKKEVKK